MTDVRDYIHYFLQLAKEHVDIKDFFVMDINEPLAALRNDIRYPALVLSSIAGKLVVPNADNTLDEIRGGFLVIDHVDNVDDFSTEMLTLQSMKQLGSEIMARMIHDRDKCEPLASKAIAGFDPDSVTYESMGPVFDNDWGFLFTFRILTTIDLDYNADVWNSEKTISGKFTY